jgi:hypothetical protein
MAYKLVCVHEFHDVISGKMINRGEEIYDYEHIAKLVDADREHHFVKVLLVMADAQWDWPPKMGVKTEAAPTPPAPEPEAE